MRQEWIEDKRTEGLRGTLELMGCPFLRPATVPDRNRQTWEQSDSESDGLPPLADDDSSDDEMIEAVGHERESSFIGWIGME